MNGTVQSDSGNIYWRTPKGNEKLGRSDITINKLIKKYDLILDPCCMGEVDCLVPKSKGGRFYTPKEDGLVQPWDANTIYNPPFAIEELDELGNPIPILDVNTGKMKNKMKPVIDKWVERGMLQSLIYNTIVIGILPVYTSIPWFHNYINNVLPPNQIVFIPGRVKFSHPDPEKATSSPNFDTMLVFWDARKR